MEVLSERRVALFPGCSLEGTSSEFLASLLEVFRVLDIQCPALDNWSCCGATSAHALDHEMHLALNARNLAAAEEQGYSELLVPCAACYHRLASAAFELRDKPARLAEVNAKTGLDYRGGVAVRNVLDFLANDTGTEMIAARVKTPLAHLNAACYYGCLNTRIPRMPAFDDVDYPMSMDLVVQALGAKTLDWSYKTECCGASLFITKEETSARLVAQVLQDALARGADCIVVSCPMCHNNLDTKQAAIREAFGIAKPVPILFVTQLIGLAFGLDAGRLGLAKHFVPVALSATGKAC